MELFDPNRKTDTEKIEIFRNRTDFNQLAG
jgi:hypothetical protein